MIHPFYDQLYICSTSALHLHDLLPVDPPEQDRRQYEGDKLRDRKCPPHMIQAQDTRQYVSRRQEHKELSGQRHPQTVDPIPQRLEHRADDDTVPGKQKAPTDPPQSRNPDRQHILRGIEKAQERAGDRHKERQSDQHQTDSRDHTEPYRLHDPFLIARTVIVSDDRHHPVIQAEHRHKDKTVQFKVYAKDSRGRGRKHQ